MITYGSTTLTSYNTITKIEVYYYKSTSATSLSGGSWSTTKPSWENGKYIWQKIRTTYEGKLENGQYYSESDPVNITGQQGQQGETGASAYSYKLNASDTIISVSKNGIYSTNSVTFSATSKQGNEDVNPYEGRLKIETTMDGITWTIQYTSSANESSKTFTIPSDISNIRCSLYQAGGTTVLLDITSVSIVRDGIDGALYPNLSPFFSHDLTDVYNAETNPNGYWIEYSSYGWTKNSNFTFTQLEDGWLHVHIDNSTGTSLIRNNCCISRYNPSIKKGIMYTFLTEFRNNQSTGLDETSNFYLVQQSGSVQFWGINTATAPSAKLEGIGGLSIRVIDIPSDGSYAIARGTKYSEPEDSSSHWTTEDAMATFTFRANAGAVIDYDIRLSMYEGEYWGNYVPYIISDVTDIRNSAETANNRAEEANNKIDNLEIGGRNFLRNTEKITANKLALSRASVPENGIIRITPTGSAGYCKFRVDYLDYINYEGTTFTASMDARIADVESTYTTANNLIVYFGVNIASRINSIFASSYDRYSSKTFTGLTSQWQRFSFSFTIPDDLGTGQTSALVEGSQVTIQIAEGGSRSPIDVRLVKLEKGNKPTDWTPAPEDVEEEISTLRTDLQSQIDEKIQTFYQSTDPASSWTTTELRTPHDGDLWYYTGTTTPAYTKDNVYRYNASNNTWSVYSASGELFDKVDGKSTIYYGTTSDIYAGVETGDYLVDSTDGSSYRWDGSEWVKVTDYKTTITNAIDNIEIGGRNLIIGTLNPDTRGDGIYRPHLPGQITNTSGRGTCTVAEHGLRFTNTTANWEYIYFGSSSDSAEPCMLGLEAGQTYTLSADLSWKILSSDTGKANTTTYGMGAILEYSTDANPNDFVTAVSDYPLLITQADKGTDMSGRLTFTFTVPSDAIRLYLGIRANNTTASHYAIGDYLEARNMKLEKGSKATDWTPAPEDVENSIKAYTESIQSQVDGMAEIHYGTDVPTLSNAPYTSWEDTETKDMHLDDLYYNTSTGYCYRFIKSDSTYSWTRIKDSDIIAATTAASNANTLAGQKRRIFVVQPTPPYEVGDLWAEGSNGDIKKCKTARATGGYTASDWELASKYTDDTTANEANDKIDNLEIGGRNLLYNSATMPAISNGNKGWRASGGTVSHIELTNPPIHNITGGIRVTNTGTSTARIGAAQDKIANKFIAGEMYTQSCWVRASENLQGYMTLIYKSSSQQATSGGIKHNITTDWTYIKIEGRTLTGEQTSSYSGGYIYVNDVPVDGWFEVCGMKLEKGNRATDWTPAPEDIENDITEAKKTATNYMSSDNTGIMVADLADGEQLPANATGKNVFITAGYGKGNSIVNAGVHIRDGQENLAFFGETAQIGKSDQGHVLLDNDSVDIKNNNDVIASFGETTVIGKEDEAHLQIESTGIYGQNTNNANDRFFEISQNAGTETIDSQQQITTDFVRNNTITQSFVIKLSDNKINNKIRYNCVVVDKRTSTGLYTITSREFNISSLPVVISINPSSGNYNGTITIRTKDKNNNLLGTITLQQKNVDLSLKCVLSIHYSKIYAAPSFTFGSRVIDSDYGGYSTASGLFNIASGNYSYAGGKETIAEGDSSFAMGTASEARGNYSVAIGEHVIAKGNNQTVIGCYNEEDDDSLFVIGNGFDYTVLQKRNNALTVDKTGNIFIYLEGSSSTSSPSSESTDRLLYSAITSLGWENEVITTN